MKPIVVLGLLALAGLPAATQTPSDSTPAAQDSAVRVFLDCPTYHCDLDYFRTEITFVNYVRDRRDAQVHILLTTEGTGAGGTAFTIAFIGLQAFAGAADTLRYASPPAATDDEVRQGLVKVLRLGLIRFAARTPVASRLQISYSAPAAAAARVRDQWNYWVYRIRMNTNLNGEKSYKFGRLDGNVSANRVTEGWKLRLSVNGGYNQSDYQVPVYDTAGVEIGTQTITNITRNYGSDGLVVRSLSAHWSAGGQVLFYSSTYENYDWVVRVAPAIEFNIFPYSESTRRELKLRYELGVGVSDYADTTIYNRTRETLLDQRLTLSLDVKQPWGSAGISLEGGHYLHDVARNRLELFGEGDFRLYKGLSFNFFGSVSLVHDQLSLPKGGATPTEVLLRRRQLETSYRYFTFAGLSYTFGSIYNTIVNPRF